MSVRCYMSGYDTLKKAIISIGKGSRNGFYLESYAFINRTKPPFEEGWEEGHLFLDSGAYSVSMGKAVIDVKDYGRYLQEFGDTVDIYANLDVIGDAEASWANQDILEDMGLMPMPCFHMNEPFDFLERMIEKYEYIALGGLTHASVKSVSSWLNSVFFLPNGDLRSPGTKFHGFGLGSQALMTTWPWYSVDSTTYLRESTWGQVLLPWTGTNSFQSVFISDRGAKFKDVALDGFHEEGEEPPEIKRGKNRYEALSPELREMVRGRVEEKGFTIEELSASIEARLVFNAEIYTEFCANFDWFAKDEKVDFVDTRLF